MKNTQITYQNVLDLIVSRFPDASVAIDNKGAKDQVTFKELAYILNKLMAPDYLINGTEATIYIKYRENL